MAGNTRWLCSIVAAVLMAGCQEEGIRRYQVPREEKKPEAKDVRLLGAIFPKGDKTWFLKMLGPFADVREHEGDFDRFAKSVRFADAEDKLISWTLPGGWKQEKGTGMRFATIRIGSKERELELTVTPLGKEAGSVLDNVNRWRGQMGLKPLAKDELASVAKDQDIAGINATLIDMAGPGIKK